MRCMPGSAGFGAKPIVGNPSEAASFETRPPSGGAVPRLVLAVPMFFLAAALQAQADSSQAGPADSVRAVVEGRGVDPAGNPLAQAEIIWQSDRRSVLSRADGGFNLVVPFRGETVILV